MNSWVRSFLVQSIVKSDFTHGIIENLEYVRTLGIEMWGGGGRGRKKKKAL